MKQAILALEESRAYLGGNEPPGETDTDDGTVFAPGTHEDDAAMSERNGT